MAQVPSEGCRIPRLSRHAAASMNAALPAAHEGPIMFRFMILFSLVWFLLLMLAQDLNPPTDLTPATTIEECTVADALP